MFSLALMPLELPQQKAFSRMVLGGISTKLTFRQDVVDDVARLFEDPHAPGRCCRSHERSA